MRACGVKRNDQGCCPGHDKYPAEAYSITCRASFRARLRPAKKRARQEARRAIERA